MLLPIPLVIFILLLVFSIKKAKQKVNVNQHVTIRLLALVAAIGVIVLLCYIAEGSRGMLGALYFSAYFTGAWLLYLLVEAISLFVIKQNKLASTNLVMLAFMVFIAVMVLAALNFA